jgi:hypothetical protein
MRTLLLILFLLCAADDFTLEVFCPTALHYQNDIVPLGFLYRGELLRAIRLAGQQQQTLTSFSPVDSASVDWISLQMSLQL